ncbi:glycosyltransferase family 2 protein [bacterium]|nr:glycosyltransferase family 2 protein [bacterium]
MDIATLIPAYKKEFIVDTITSCLNQSLKPKILMISDDSPDNKIFDSLSKNAQLAHLCHERQIKLQIIKGPKQGPLANTIHILNKWDFSTNFFHILMDDDIICPNFYEQHHKSRSDNDTTCVVSKRWLAGKNNLPYLSPSTPALIDLKSNRVQSVSLRTLSKTIFPQCFNWLGELSNATFHSDFAKDIGSAKVLNQNIFGLLDIGTFFGAAADNKLFFLDEHLSFFRIHENQNTNTVNPNLFFGYSDWLLIAKLSLERGLLKEADFWRVFDKIVMKQLASRRELFCQYPELLVFYQQLDALNHSKDIYTFFQSWDGEMQRWFETNVNCHSKIAAEIQIKRGEDEQTRFSSHKVGNI